MDKINDGGLACGMSLLDYMATKIMAGFVVEGAEGAGHSPGYEVEDFQKIEGKWDKETDPYPWIHLPKEFTKWQQVRRYAVGGAEDTSGYYRLISTYESRCARDAYRYARALLAARGGAK